MKKPHLFKNPHSGKSSFVLQEDRVPYFYDKLHYHAEFQLTAMIQAEGTRFVGSAVSTFNSGEIYLLGANLPHVFRCAPSFYARKSKKKAHGLSLYFNATSFGDKFFQLPEAKKIDKLLQDSSRGIYFFGQTAIQVEKIMIALKETKGFGRVTQFLSILKLLSESAERKIISGIGFNAPLGDENNKRLDRLFHYLSNNFKEEVDLKTLSKLVGMSATGLCKFFKQRTRKTLFTFLTEIRIENACKLLADKTISISEIAFESGYKNTSNFNRQFKELMKMTPRQYANSI